MPDFAEDCAEVLDRAGRDGIEHVVVIGFDLASSRAAIALAEQHARVFVSVGIHPHDASSVDDSAGEELRRLARHPKVVAVGETGLDFYRNLSPRPEQFGAFYLHLDVAEELGLPVVIHDREAHEDTLKVLSKRAKNLVGGVLHCFSGDTRLAETALDWGFYISLAGPLTYPNANALRSVARQLPLESIVIETDAPYLTPQPRRGTRNEPAFVRFVADELARIKELHINDIDRITTLNARRLFGLPREENADVTSYPVRDRRNYSG
jgi:TatD DNase family protein